jgi:hypothetical protein
LRCVEDSFGRELQNTTRQEELVLSSLAGLATGQPVRLESAALRENTTANVRKELDFTDDAVTPTETPLAA